MVSMSLQNTASLLLFFISTWMLVSSQIYKSIMWTTNNPYFQNHNNSKQLKSFCFGGDLLMIVKLKSLLPVICPFEDLIMQQMDSQPSSGVLYENLWIVYDKESYDSCKVNESFTVGRAGRLLKNKRLHKCDSPAPLNNYFYRIDFAEYSPVQSDLYFEGNTTYYFLATSDGTQGSLDQKSGGHCNNDGDNEIRMKFKVYVCGDNEFFTDPRCLKNATIGEFICEKPDHPTPNPTKAPVSTTSSKSSVTESISATTVTTTENDLNTGEPKSGKRKDDDSELRKDRDLYLSLAIALLCLLIFLLIIMGIILYRLKKKYSVPCIYSASNNKINSSDQELPPIYTNEHAVDKLGLVNRSFDDVDGHTIKSVLDGDVHANAASQTSSTVITNPNTATSQDNQPSAPPYPNSLNHSTNDTATNAHIPGNNYEQHSMPNETTMKTGIPTQQKLPPIKRPINQKGVNDNSTIRFDGTELHL